MKKLLFVVFALMFLLAGCAAKEEQTGGQMEGMTESGGHETTGQMAAMSEEAGHGEMKVTKHYEDSMTKVTDNKLYSLEMVIPHQQLMMGVNNVEIIVHDTSDGDVAQADVTVTPWMPSMGHGVMQKPVVTERGGGVYSIENIVLTMTGHWQLQVKVAKDGKEDTAVFDFPEVNVMGHEHTMLHAPPPPDLDYSTTKMTANNAFNVTYSSASGPIRPNRFMSWELTIKDADGKPVNDAKVTVVGDMPQHGHGLPTQPEVTPMGAGGLYRVEGMKFQMPGWWVVTFGIMANGVEDSVSFNLNIL